MDHNVKETFRSHVNYKTILLLICDAVNICLAQFLALFLRTDLSITAMEASGFLRPILKFMPVSVCILITIYMLFKLYRGIWKFAGLDEFMRIALACLTGTVLYIAAFLLYGRLGVHQQQIFPISYPFLFLLLQLAFTTLIRFFYRFASKIKTDLMNRGSRKRTLIVGAGRTGVTVLRNLETSSHSDFHVVGFVDRNPEKLGKYIHGVKVVGNDDNIPDLVNELRIDSIIIAIPAASQSEKRRIIELCEKTDCNLRIVPAIYQLANGDVNIEQMRNVEIEDLLGRDSIVIDSDEIFSTLRDQVVLVTGGGGSIGSELCRQIACHAPRQLIIVDIYENNAYALQQELLTIHPDLDLKVLIASVRDAERINGIFAAYKPAFVFHAAAHKHVPLMEYSPNEAIKNNVFGTYNVARAADANDVRTFILISTDKAVNPTNIMGASKRLCEMIIECFSRTSKTRFAAVRFGNVLGSNGSVIPLFKEQIRRGGPVTVTHKDIIRYFMTIPESVSLVLQACAYAKGGEIFVLDMGQPVKIDDLARRMIKLSGFEPDVDIKIQYTGLRPGEKLYEELLMSEEGLQTTQNQLIFIGKLTEFDYYTFFDKLAYLRDRCNANDPNICRIVADIVPTYHLQNEEVS